MTDAKASFGTLLKMGDGEAVEVFTTVAEVTDIQGPGLALRTAEVSAHDGVGWSEFIGTIKDGGDVTFTLNFLPDNATHDDATGLIAEMVARTVRNFRIEWPDDGATIWEFAALVVACPPAAPVDGALTASVTLKVSGAPDFAAT